MWFRGGSGRGSGEAGLSEYKHASVELRSDEGSEQ
jgi:hypothetical protein